MTCSQIEFTEKVLRYRPMLPKKKIKTSLILTVSFLLITFTIPMTLLAEPPAKCPCFNVVEVMRYAPPRPDTEIYEDGYGFMRVLELEDYVAAFRVGWDYGDDEKWLGCSALVYKGDINSDPDIIFETYTTDEYGIGGEAGEACIKIMFLGLPSLMPDF